MPYLRCKTGVRPRSLIIAAAAVNAATVLGFTTDVTVTSGDEPTTVHVDGSRHATGNALDLRTKHLSDRDLADWLGEIRRRLGADYQLIVEQRARAGEHLHVEWDPPRRLPKTSTAGTAETVRTVRTGRTDRPPTTRRPR